MAKTRTNVLIDESLKKVFEDTKGVHGATLGDATDIGMRYILTRMNQLSMVDSEITRKKAEISYLSLEVGALEINREKIRDLCIQPIIENKSNGNSEALEKRREDVFKKMTAPREEKTKTKGVITIQPDIVKIIAEWESGNALVKWDWGKLIEKCGFKSKEDAVSWFDKRIKALAAAKEETLPSSL